MQLCHWVILVRAHCFTSNQNNMESNINQESEKAPIWKMIMDDFMLLLFIGVTVYAVFYLIWGVMELSNLPQIPGELKDQVLK